MARLWNYFGGEPYMDNPRLLLFNSPKKKRTKGKPNMARKKKAHRKASHRHNTYMPMTNRKKKHAKRHKRNPPMFLQRDVLGFKLGDILYGAGAVLVNPLLEQQVQGLVAQMIPPTSPSAQTAARWITKVGTAAGTVWIAGRAFGPKVRDLTMIALGSNLMAEAVNEFVIPPTVTVPATATTTVGAYLPAGRVGAYLPRTRVAAYLPAGTMRVGSFTGASRVTGPFPAPF